MTRSKRPRRKVLLEDHEVERAGVAEHHRLVGVDLGKQPPVVRGALGGA